MEDNDSVDPRTVFVKGVSFDWDNDKFEKAFSDVGPVRKCFLLKSAGKHHKGCGFVTFALQEDAERAVRELNEKTLGGRKLQVERAQRRAPFSERMEKKRKRKEDTATAGTDDQPAQAAVSSPAQGFTAEAKIAEAKAKTVKPRAPKRPKTEGPANEKQKLVRTVALGNLSAANRDQAVAYAQGVTEVDAVGVPSHSDIEAHMLHRDGCAGDAVFLVYKTVKEALHAVTQLHNHVLQATEAPGINNKKKGAKRAVAGAGTLLWARQVSGDGRHLKKWRLILRNLPFNVEESALREVLSPAGFVWELTVPRSPDGKARGFGFAGFMCRAHAEKAIKLANGKQVGGRTIAVDWAVSKLQFKSNTEQELGKGPAPDIEDDEGDEVSDGGDEEGVFHADDDMDGEAAADESLKLEKEKELLRNVVSQFGGEGDVADQDGDRPVTKPARPEASAQAAAGAARSAPGTTSGNVYATVFVRGLPLDVLQYEVEERLSRFGKLRACRLVQDKGTKKLKGTAFVEFERQEDAEAAAGACAKARSGQGPDVSVRGRPMEVDVALTQDDARMLASGKATQRGSKDNRNLYLLKEGLIEEGSAAWQAMSATDRTKRKRAAAEARTKLKSPNFFLSRTRLCLRNLPLKLNEKTLKQLVTAAVKERAANARPVVKQVKILREADKVGADGKAASKGWAFVELTEHEHALCALRQLNNNPVPFGTERRPIVEFAIENAQTLKKREMRRPRMLRAGAAPDGDAEDGIYDAEGSPLEPTSDNAAADAAAAPAGKAKRKQRKNKRGERAKPQDANIVAGTAAASPGPKPAYEGLSRGEGKRGRDKKAAGSIPPVTTQAASSPVAQSPAGSMANKRRKRKDVGTPADRSQKEGQQEGGQGVQKKHKRQKTDNERHDKLDGMVANYKAQLFGEGKGKTGGKGFREDMKRWFD